MEDILQYVWRHRLLPLKPLVTTQGIPLEVIDAGVFNPNAGPDFLNAKVKIGSTIWVGHVEIHVHSSDWYNHRHDADPAFNMVVLHVVQTADSPVYNQLREIIPQLVVQVPPYIQERYEVLRQSSDYPRCHPILSDVPSIKIHAWMNALMAERIAMKEERIAACLRTLNGDWNDCLFATLARNFGFGLNGDAFEEWALSFSLRAVDKHRDSLMQVEALFFGQAGLLDEQAVPLPVRTHLAEDMYWQALRREYTYLAHKFQLHPISFHKWKLLRTRPHNFPHIRIAQLAWLYHRHTLDLSRLDECRDIRQVRELLQADTSGYWKLHYAFGLSTTEMHRQLMLTTKDLLIINTVIPLLVAYRKHRMGDWESILGWYEQLKPESNRMIRQWQACGIVPQHAGDSQALIQLKSNYCDRKRCLHCRFGYYYMCKER